MSKVSTETIKLVQEIKSTNENLEKLQNTIHTHAIAQDKLSKKVDILQWVVGIATVIGVFIAALQLMKSGGTP